MRRVRVEMFYRSRCPDCIDAYRNLQTAIWRLQGSIVVDVRLSPASEPAKAPSSVLEPGARLDPIQLPAFLFNDEHLLHGNAAPAFIHDVLQTLAEPQPRTASLWTGFLQWTS